MARTLFVEPWVSGHRLQWVGWIARTALARGDELVLLTSKGTRETPQFDEFLADLPIDVVEVFTENEPPAAVVGDAILALHRDQPVDTYVVSDADTLVKDWWRAAPRGLRRGKGRPRSILVMVRYPPRFPWRDSALLKIRLGKTVLCHLAHLRGAADRVVFLVGRDDARPGRLFKRVRDPAICTFHRRDRAELRARFGLPGDRRLVGILGSVSMRKNVPIVLEAARRAGEDVDVLLAGSVWDDVLEWLDTLSPEESARVHRRIGFLSDEELDAYVAASDVVACAHSNPGPSGIMGKALAAGVPVLSSGSRVRRREATALAFGIHTDLAPGPMAEGLRTLLADGSGLRSDHVDLASPDDFGRVVLGLQRNGAPRPVPAG